MDKEQAATQQEIESLNLDRARQRIKITELEKVIIEQAEAISEARSRIRDAQQILKELI